MGWRARRREKKKKNPRSDAHCRKLGESKKSLHVLKCRRPASANLFIRWAEGPLLGEKKFLARKDESMGFLDFKEKGVKGEVEGVLTICGYLSDLTLNTIRTLR